MAKLNYCINCGEAVELESFMRDFKSYDEGGFFGSSGYRWDNPFFAICINEKCRLYGVMMRRVNDKPPKRISRKKEK